MLIELQDRVVGLLDGEHVSESLGIFKSFHLFLKHISNCLYFGGVVDSFS